jgi:4-amino-4-deoxy-L-arabinose transferase-like glycosyltransferase
MLYLTAGMFYTRYVLRSSFLLILFLAGFGVRVVLAFVLYFTHPPDGHIFRDDLYYMRTGLAILEQWKTGQFLNLDMYRLVAGSRNWGYSFYNALHYLMTPSHLLPGVSNAFVGSLLGIAVYKLARELFDVRVARISAVLTAFHSGLIWYSAVNLKDSLVALTIVLTLFYGVSSVRRHGIKDLLKMLGAAVILFPLRFYMAPFTLTFVALYWFLHSCVPLRRKLFLIGVLVLGVSLAASFLPGVETLLNQIRRAGGVPEFFLSYGERSLSQVQGKETTILGKLEEFGPTSMAITGARFILNPSPFNLHDITWLLLPGILLWYALLPFFFTGGLALVRRRPAEAALLFGLVVGGILLYSFLPKVSETRHRFQFTAIAIIVATWGLLHLRPWHKLVAISFWAILIFGLALMKLGVIALL